MSSTPPYEHTITGTPHYHDVTDKVPESTTTTTRGPIDRQPATNLSNPLSLVSSNARKFVRPNGQLVHVAGSPDEERRLRKRLTHQNSMSGVLEEKDEDGGNEIWDIVIHGSPEHIDALKETHERAKTLRDELKSKYGTDWDHLEGVVRELDRLNHELHMLSQHAVNLDANFSKYGYSATLRTLPGSGEQSTATSLYGDHSTDHDHDWEAEKQKGGHMRFYARPAIRQYFHKGLLWRGSDTTEVASYELFLDLLYVGIIAIAGDGAAEGADGHALLIFAVTFTMTWKLWGDVQQFAAWISMDDIVRRLSVVLMLAILLGITVNISGSYDETYVPLVAFYIFGRWYCAVYFVWMGYLMPIVRAAMFGSAFVSAFPPFIWLASMWVEQPQRQALIWIALPLDIFGPVILIHFERGRLSILPKWLLDWCHRTWEFFPGNNIEHKIERTNAFVGLVFGYSVVALLYQSTVKFPLNAFYGKAVLGMLQSFAFNWMYFEIDTFNLHTHAIRRSVLTGKFLDFFFGICYIWEET
jgi:low temperature requirement protein LtrA